MYLYFRILKKNEVQQSTSSGPSLNIEDLLLKVDKMTMEDHTFSGIESSDEDSNSI